MRILSPTITSLTQYGSVRSQVSPIIDGPKSISWKTNNKDFWGAPLLRLSIRNLQMDQVETRSIYANLFDKTRPLTLLRCIYWNGGAARDQIHFKKRVDLTIQARFVILHMRTIKSWLKILDGLSTSLHTEYEQDPSQPIKSLRIELDYATWVFERKWQLSGQDYGHLEQKWNDVWIKMGRKISGSARPDLIEENFAPYKVTPKYDLQKYTPFTLASTSKLQFPPPPTSSQ